MDLDNLFWAKMIPDPFLFEDSSYVDIKETMIISPSYMKELKECSTYTSPLSQLVLLFYLPRVLTHQTYSYGLYTYVSCQ